MNESLKDLGVATALLNSLTAQGLPRALALRDKVERGERIEDWDIEFLYELCVEAEQVKPTLDKLPEFQAVYAQAASLYKEIADKALENEKGAMG
jgi:hypothetical protein